MTFTPADGSMGWSHKLHEFEEDGGVFLGMYNTNSSIQNFARLCFEEALTRRLPLKLAIKQGFFRQYDARYTDIFSNY